MRASLNVKLGGVTLLVLLLALGVSGGVTYRLVQGQIGALVNAELLPRVAENNDASLEHFSKLLRRQAEKAREQAQGWFALNGENLARGLATQLLPFVENFDYEGVEGAVQKLVTSNPLVEGARAVYGDGGEEVTEAGRVEAENLRSFAAEASSDMATLEVTVAVSTKPLTDAFSQMETTFHASLDEVHAKGKALSADLRDKAQTGTASALASLSRTLAVVSVLSLVFLFVVFAFATRRLVVAPLLQLREAFGRLAAGDLKYRLPVRSRDEVGEVQTHFNGFAEQLASIIGVISGGAGDLNDRSQEIANAVEEIVAVVHEQNRSAATVEDRANEIDGMIRSTVESTDAAGTDFGTVSASFDQIRAAVDGAVDTSRTTVEGVREVHQQAGRLAEVAREVPGLVNDINDLADQTNLLALNAAIEAARAGESGRGFAVVADEVRKLAESTQRATQRISLVSQQIGEGLGRVETSLDEAAEGVQRGSKATEAIPEAIGHAVEALGTMQQRIESIREDAQEEQTRADQVRSLAGEVKSGTEELLQSTGFVSTSLETLRDLANRLDDQLRAFGADDTHADAPPPTGTAP